MLAAFGMALLATRLGEGTLMAEVELDSASEHLPLEVGPEGGLDRTCLQRLALPNTHLFLRV